MKGLHVTLGRVMHVEEPAVGMCVPPGQDEHAALPGDALYDWAGKGCQQLHESAAAALSLQNTGIEYQIRIANVRDRNGYP